jgi:hypothetical protein
MSSQEEQNINILKDALKYYGNNYQQYTLSQVQGETAQDAMHSHEASAFLKIISPFVKDYGSLTIQQICKLN